MSLQTHIRLGYSCSKHTILIMGDEEVDAGNHAFHG
jgi:hypothetical protein